MEKVGFVRRVVDDKVELVFTRASGCGNCNGCAGGCETKAHIVIVENSLDAKVGDFVELRGESKIIMRYMFIIYMFPFAFLIAGILIGNSYFKSIDNPNYELLSFGTGVLALSMSFIFIRLIDRRVAKSGKATMFMTRIL
ncbi:Fis family transcriptional regulator [Tissierella creatinini]|nr:Fis family transcriptional regulator [Tissierella creatinini]TJX69229.1 Fis family transcriptional regulator [Soehngenia saccharolytica]